MPRRVELRIAGDTVQKSRSRAGVQGEGNVTDLVCSFDASWDDLAKTLTFWDAEMANPVKIVLTENLLTGMRRYTVKIPPEPLKIAGNCTVTVDGALDGVRARTVGVELEVAYSPITDSASEPVDPTPTQAEQLQAATDAAAKLATEAKNLAEKQDAVFVVTYGEDSIDGVPTESIIADAYRAGKAVICREHTDIYDARYWMLSKVDTVDFENFYFTNGKMWAEFHSYLPTGERWTCGEIESGTETHADTHAADGSDPITPESIGAISALGESIADPEVNIDDLVLTKCYLCGATVIKNGLKGDLAFQASHLLKVEDFTGDGRRAIQTAVLNNTNSPQRKWRLWNGTVWSAWQTG